jgi:hypothetical protein
MKIQWIPTILASILGVLGGTAGAHYVMNQRIATADASIREANQTQTALNTRLNALELTVDTLRVERDEAEYELMLARLEIEEAKRAQAPAFESLETDEEEPETRGNGANLVEDASEEGPRRRGRGDWNPEERMARMRAEMDERIIARWERAEDPGQKERIALFAEHQQYMMDLTQEMMSAEDDSARARVREEMSAARDNFRAVVQNEQSKLIASMGQRYGVNSKQTAEFERAFREMLRDPAFTDGGMMIGGGGRGGRGGPRAEDGEPS